MAGSLSDWFKSPSRGEQLRSAGVREDLVQASERTAFGRQSDSLLRALPDVLSDDEVVADLLEGRHDKHIGLLVLTTQRIVFMPKPSHRSEVAIVALSDVISVSSRTHRGLGNLTFTLSGGEFVVDQILGTQAETFAGHVLATRSQPASSAGPADPASPAAAVRAAAVRDPIDELIELRAMHRAGAVSDSEYRLRKQVLFDRI